jgi:GNAT superfamily N-acetyltransferase
VTTTTPAVTVRSAVFDDTDWISAQACEFAAFYGMPSLTADAMEALALIDTLVFQGPFFVAEVPGGERGMERAGFLAAAVTPHPYNPALAVCQELFWWVRPGARGTGAGSALLDAFIAYGRAHADVLAFTLLPQTPVDERVLLTRGFRLTERVYTMEVGT